MVAANPDEFVPGDPSRARGAPQAASAFASALAQLAAIPLALTAAVLAIEHGFELGSGFLIAALAVGFVLAAVMLIVGLRDLRAEKARTREAVERAVAAEANQRTRAGELARVLKASESLVLTGEGKVDYLGVLEAITPGDATSFLVLPGPEGTEGLVVAAHGPLAAVVVGVRRPLPLPGGGLDPNRGPIASYSATGHHVGVAVPREHMAGADTEIEAGLRITLIGHDGASLGWLHMVDHTSERVLEPSFVSMAQLVAHQIGVALENNALVARVRTQLVEVQRVQQRLVQASKLSAVGELAAAVAHEVNNPLTGILGFSELLMDELPEGDPRHEEALVIRNEAVRARSIVKSMLEFARPRQPQRIPANLNDVARSTLELIHFRASQAAVRIVADFADLPRLEVDPDAFRQVLLSLYSNAIDAMPSGGILRVATVDQPDRVGVVVADEGVGMDDETRRRIFTPFFTPRTGTGGHELGLSVSLQIVEGHGGTIEVESRPGSGSTFTVWLPRSVFEGAAAESEDQAVDPAALIGPTGVAAGLPDGATGSPERPGGPGPGAAADGRPSVGSVAA